MRLPTNILFYGDYGRGINTGFSNVLHNIRPRIKSLFGDDIHTDVCAMNYQGDMYQEQDGTWVFSAVHCAPDAEYDAFGRIGLSKILKQSTEPDEKTGELKGYDGLFILHDAGVILPFVPLFKEVQADNARENKRNFKSIFYTPIDCEYNADSLVNIDWFDCIVTYNDFARRQILQHRPDLRKKIKIVPHGVDTSVFYPMVSSPLERTEGEVGNFRKAYFGKHAGKFIITNVNRNQHRKDIPATLFSFMEYKKINPDAYLYLHMHPNDPLGWDLRAALKSTKLREGVDVGFPPAWTQTVNGREYEMYDTDAATLNKIYNASDVFLTTTRGEGWGLTVTEAMACRLPVICPLNTSFFEITDNGRRAYVLENQYPVMAEKDNIMRGQIDPDEGAAMLDRVWNEIRHKSDTLLIKTQAAYDYVQTLSWHNIAKQWKEIFKEVY